MMSMPSSEITTVMPAKSTARPAVSRAIAVASADARPSWSLLPVAGDDEQGVVDADAEADHGAERGGEARDRHDVGEEPADPEADADADDRGADGQAHGEHRAERHDEDDDGEGEAERLRRRGLEPGEGLAADLDLHPGLAAVPSFSAASCGASCRRPCPVLDARQGDRQAGVADLAGLGAGAGDLAGPAGRGRITVTWGSAHGVEEPGDRRLHRRVVHALVGAEHDPAVGAAAGTAELRRAACRNRPWTRRGPRRPTRTSSRRRR